jgi:peptide/nickel transport system ATP-binding protein
VEEARVEALLANPQHPYTYGLMASIPRLALMTGRNEKPGGRLQEILSMMLALTDPPPGCVFAPRCAHADDRCRQTYPAYEKKRPQHWTTCWRPAKLFGAGND